MVRRINAFVGYVLRGGYDPGHRLHHGLSRWAATTVSGFAPDVRALAVFALLGVSILLLRRSRRPHRDDLHCCGAGAVLWSILTRKEVDKMNGTVYLGANGTDLLPQARRAAAELDRQKRQCAGVWRAAKRPDGAFGRQCAGCRRPGDQRRTQVLSGRRAAARGTDKLIVTEDIPARKTKMIELGDAFIAFPGGTGTLEEITEVISKLSLGQLDAPCILYDLNGYLPSLCTSFAADDHHGAFYSGAAAEHRLCRRPCSDPRNP